MDGDLWDRFFSFSGQSRWASGEDFDDSEEAESPAERSLWAAVVSGIRAPAESEDSGLRSAHSETLVSAIVRRKKNKRLRPHLGTLKQALDASKDLQWDYSATTNLGNIYSRGLKLVEYASNMPETVSIETIYQTLIEHRHKTGADSRRTQLACRKMQSASLRVAKMCSEFAERLGGAGNRTSKLEDDQTAQTLAINLFKAHVDDAQWKLTDLEDRLRRNNLRVSGIPEGVEGGDTRRFIVELFEEAFPDLAE
ncbi:hypothetical protein NDU88_006630 [Pleurodeles waltl]|uniref:Uncharacterized protein n=1 Tax=Pleurodeles waltl TaxID=8319 RepID=A0AAV7M0P3_PLEWA|nr:hypothetical protein NDU88_006630 [Pleurodeles waltl]